MGGLLIARHKLSPPLLGLNTSLQRLQQQTYSVALAFPIVDRKFRMTLFLPHVACGAPCGRPSLSLRAQGKEETNGIGRFMSVDIS